MLGILESAMQPTVWDIFGTQIFVEWIIIKKILKIFFLIHKA